MFPPLLLSQTPPSSIQNVLVKNHPSGCQFLECGLQKLLEYLRNISVPVSSVRAGQHGMVPAASARIDLVQQGLICCAQHFLSHVPLKVSGPVQDLQRFLLTQKFPGFFYSVSRCGSSLNLNFFLIRAELLENQIYLQEKPRIILVPAFSRICSAYLDLGYSNNKVKGAPQCHGMVKAFIQTGI